MVIRSDNGNAHDSRDAIVSALERASGAPRWLCELVWQESLEDRKSALDLLKRLAPLPLTREAARAALDALDSPREQARARGRERAREDLRAGRFYRLGSGLIRAPASFCPNCRIRIPYSADRADTCATCGTPVLHARSTGCILEPGTRPYVEGYHAEVDAYLRERFPGFSWDDLDS